MFHRSYLESQDSEDRYVVSTVVDGEGMAYALKQAINSPSDLKRRILLGEDPLSIWFETENMHVFSRFTLATGIVLDSASRSRRMQIMPSAKSMAPVEILDFCKSIHIHPAHLVPMDADPRLTLPLPLLQLLVEMSTCPDTYKPDDVQLAKIALSYEEKRINKYLCECQRIEDSQTEEGRNGIIFRDKVDTVLKNGFSRRLLAREFSYYASSKRDGIISEYPILGIIRNVAYFLEKSGVAELETRFNRAQNVAELRYQELSKYFRALVSSDSQKDQELFFLADIKDGLLDRDIEPKEATVEDIIAVINDLLPESSGLKMAHTYLCSRGLASDEQYKDVTQEHVETLATVANLCFLGEHNVSKAKRKYEAALPQQTLREAEIYVAFRSPSVQEGTLYNQLMKSKIAMAILNELAPPVISAPR